MHSLNFQTKMAHLRQVRFSEKIVEKVKGMTAARFDLLYLLRAEEVEVLMAMPETETAPAGKFMGGAGMEQRELWRRLGVSRVTVSKMLKRLEEMGWIIRLRGFEDRRTKTVWLTPLGRVKIWKAMRRVFRPKVWRKRYEKMFASKEPGFDVIPRLMGIWDDIDRIARSLGDRSKVRYDFGQWDDHRSLA